MHSAGAALAGATLARQGGDCAAFEQLLLAAGLANLNPMQIVPYLYYPIAIGFAAVLAIVFRYPKKY